ncbi:MAG: hypothetical protein DLM59_08830 [Pseudonocardiales bacterium]|nr:MAG: hypothetical protein DLM59_08830 [Pseudonocardiales bacterium]
MTAGGTRPVASTVWWLLGKRSPHTRTGAYAGMLGYNEAPAEVIAAQAGTTGRVLRDPSADRGMDYRYLAAAPRVGQHRDRGNHSY